MTLTARQAEILRRVVENYIATYEPVGSTDIAGRLSEEVSPATVRSEMKELEEEGWLTQPHTSAGRVPTDKGYRFFVDHLHRLKTEIEAIETELARRQKAIGHAKQALQEAALALSEVTGNMTLAYGQDSFVVQGHSQMVSQPEFPEIANEIMQMLDTPRDFLDPIAQTLEDQTVAAFIGSEWGRTKDLGIVIGRTGSNQVVSVVGPKRMNYKKVIPAVEVIIRLLG
jgi:transcriptional regulator of heat shock response